MIDTFKDTYKSLFSKLTISIWAIASIGSILAGPFGTFESMSFASRCAYWPLVTTSSILLGYLAHALTRMVFDDGENTKSRMMAGTLGTLFITTDVFWLSRLFSPERASSAPYLQLMGWVGFVFFAVLLARSIFMNAVLETSKSSVATAIELPPHSSITQVSLKPRLMERLPELKDTEVLRLSANDHFVHVLTAAGEHPIRMRLRDAISEMDGVEGTLVHRSHWVAQSAMQGVLKEQGKVYLLLKNGDRVPVSRNYRADVEQLAISVSLDGAGEQSEVSVQ
ncbi:LytTR family DNA-binding domain-containing protein [Cognatishimia activa]|uniref:LytTR family DNA-binding domain-containing protein n=1 Tax=Cognatishimia activa TaxID=1715691 RepID=UPI00222EA5ED|nr:LytTR family DNA-binding domain-containing protein [Cognatishimia activa]UZD89654.1 LytTR family transcriptional regulator [Cognatishimia activa]